MLKDTDTCLIHSLIHFRLRKVVFYVKNTESIFLNSKVFHYIQILFLFVTT